MFEQLENSLNGLESSKVTERTRSATKMSEILNDKNIINMLNENDSPRYTWDRIVGCLNSYMLKESEKITEDEARKKTTTLKRAGADLLIHTIKLANRGDCCLDVERLLKYVHKCFKIPSLRRCFSETYLNILKDHILSKDAYFGEIEEVDWLATLDLLKTLYEKSLTQRNYDSLKILQCLLIVIEQGPLHKMPVTTLRQEFEFITKICKEVSSSKPRLYQEVILKIFVAFCEKNVSDCCMACCKLGEDVLANFLSLYDKRSLDGNMKIHLFKCFLIQLRIHHPNGSTEGSTTAYACNWKEWKRRLQSLYSILCVEIADNLKVKLKPAPLYISEVGAKKIHNVFITLFVEVFKQVHHKSVKEDPSETLNNDDHRAKRARIESGISIIISAVQESKDWPWIHILKELLSKYPNLIKSEEFMQLLQVLSTLQSECKDVDIRRHIHSCLTVMVDVQMHLPKSATTGADALWSVIWESTLRSAGLNQNLQQTHALLQKLIWENKTRQFVQLFRMYLSGVPKITKNSLLTLHSACLRNYLPEKMSMPGMSSSSTRKNLLHWILSVDNEKTTVTDIYSNKSTAFMLVFLLMKQWPMFIVPSSPVQRSLFWEFDNFEDICIYNSFEKLIVEEKKSKNDKLKPHALIIDDIMEELCSLLEELTRQILQKQTATPVAVKEVFYVLILMNNLLSVLVDFEIVSKESFDTFKVTVLLKRLMQFATDFMCLFVQGLNSNYFLATIEILRLIETLFSSNLDAFVMKKLREFTTIDFLKSLFSIVNGIETDEDDDELTKSNDYSLKVRVAAMQALCSYIFVEKIEELSDTQNHALESIAEPNYQPKLKDDYKMALTLLKTIKRWKVGIIPEEILVMVLDNIQNICEVHYNNYESALQILEILFYLYPHIAASNSEKLKDRSVTLLVPFYEGCNNYGPKVSVAVINCMGQITKVDPAALWSNWSGGRNVTLQIPNFLNNDSQEVRLTAIRNMVPLFSAASNGIENCERQKILFSTTCDKSMEVFQIEGTLTNERKVDETVTRTASVLHSLATIMVTSTVWRPHAIFNLLHIAFQKNLNMSSVQTIMQIVAKKLHYENVSFFISNYISYLIKEWQGKKYKLTNFPYNLLNCDTVLEFFVNFTDNIIPLLMNKEDITPLEAICERIERTPFEVIEEAFPKIIATAAENLSPIEGIKDTIAFKHMICMLGEEKIIKLLTERIDDTIVQLIELVSDMDHFKSKFKVNYILPELNEKPFTVESFNRTLSLLEKNMPGDTSILKLCVYTLPNKLQKIILSLTVDIHNGSGLEEKVKAFHRYTIFIDMLLPLLHDPKNNSKAFLIRDIVHTLVHLINKNYQNYTVVNIIAAMYLKAFCSKILPAFSKIFKEFLIVIVATIVPIIMRSNSLGEECLGLLNYLIVFHKTSLADAIKDLDPLPDEDNFASAMRAIRQIKLAASEKINRDVAGQAHREKAAGPSHHEAAAGEPNGVVSFSDDSKEIDKIKTFLKTGNLMKNVGSRLEGLKNLNLVLRNSKEELRNMYEKLKTLRGFSEDCEKSMLHQLICMLVKYTAAPDVEVSLEATRCLGQLGPADLTTMVLYSENNLPNVNHSPFQITTGKVIAMLSEYIVDPNINAVKAASAALYSVLDCREGSIAVEFDERFGSRPINKSYLYPFLALKKARSESVVSVINDTFEILIKNDELWVANVEHEKWIVNLVSSLLQTFNDKCYLKRLIPICQAKVAFAEELFPVLISLFLYSNNKMCVQIISEQMQNFFTKHWELHDETQSKNEIVLQRASVQCMLNVVHYARLQKSLNSNNRTMADLSLDYLKVAQAAQFCSAHFTALLYVELWCQTHLENLNPSEKHYTMTLLDFICQKEDPQIQQNLQSIMRKAYTEVGELDALHGCGSSRLLSSINRVDRYKQMERWDLVALHYDLQISYEAQTAVPELMQALKQWGLYQLPLQYNDMSEQCSSNKSDYQYECAWRLSDWTLNLPKKISGTSNVLSFEKCRYSALKYLQDKDIVNFNTAINDARESVINSLRHASLESSKNLYKALTQLQSLQEIEDMYQAKSCDNFDALLEHWKLKDGINRNEFQYVEPILAQRIAMLKNVLDSKDTSVKKHFVDFCLDLSEQARLEGYINIAQRSLGVLSYVSDLPPEVTGLITLEESQVYWKTDMKTARYVLKNFLDQKPTDGHLFGRALKLYGTWMAETRSENSQTIIADYFLESMKVCNHLEKSPKEYDNLFDTYDVVARYADKEYQRYLTYIKSSEFEIKVKNMEKLKETALNIKKRAQSSNSIDERRAVVINERHSLIDEIEINNTYKEKDTYLNLAVRYYLGNLLHFDKNNLRIFRVISLWIENRMNTEVAESLKTKLAGIASYKFIPILPQLVPHITNNPNDSFGKQITLLIERCAKDHPHHTLPIIMGIANSNKDEEYTKTSAQTESNEERIQASISMLKKLKKIPSLTRIIEEMEKLCEALIDLAYIKEEKCKSLPKSKTEFEIPNRAKIRSIKNFSNVLLPSLTIPIRKDHNYDNIVGIHNFGTSFLNVGGVNAPKRITCTGTDGVMRLQLVKGQDDLRQDAVMQQVFNIMNSLLGVNKHTTKLLIRTYKVFPLSKRSGILEWVENSMPLGDYLIGKKGAHQMYHPRDKKPDQCRDDFKKAAKVSNEEKLKIYNIICKQLKPVFHKFFETSFPQPTIWYERRRAYVHSVATSSMCGYILGLGDRHVQNILIDKITAEVVHIDFGIAFEQGRVLPTPETVPFRLTRDIEDGMGVTGIEGVFKRACEKTMEVLRLNTETIITILEVLLYDPLYSWTITPEQAYNWQRDKNETARDQLNFSDGENTPVNVTAERALLRLRHKLQGTEEGGPTSVEGQVEKLIQQARDPANLCKMFVGWQPYL